MADDDITEAEFDRERAAGKPVEIRHYATDNPDPTPIPSPIVCGWRKHKARCPAEGCKKTFKAHRSKLWTRPSWRWSRTAKEDYESHWRWQHDPAIRAWEINATATGLTSGEASALMDRFADVTFEFEESLGRGGSEIMLGMRGGYFDENFDFVESKCAYGAESEKNSKQT